MNAIRFLSFRAIEVKAFFSPTGELPGLVGLTVVLNARTSHLFHRTYAPNALLELIRSNSIQELTVETLDWDGMASKLLPENPMFVVSKVVTTDGRRLSLIPSRFRSARRYLVGVGVALMLAAIGVWGIQPLVAAFAMLAGGHAVRSGASIPV